MSFVWPQALLALVPAALILARAGRSGGLARWLRWALAVLLALAAARPELQRGSAGSDVVVVVDRSRSMPHGSESRAEELIRLAAAERRSGDRLGVVSFGREPRLERALSADGAFGGLSGAVDGEASNLEAALERVGELIPSDRRGRVLVLSDGNATGPDPKGAARRLAARGLVVDVRWLGREEGLLDVAATRLEVPSAVGLREPFLLTATVVASRPVQATLQLSRDGKVLARTQRALPEGPTLMTFRDVGEARGVATYELRLSAAGDAVPENDAARALVRVEAPSRVLLVSSRPDGAVVRGLRAAGLEVDAVAPRALTLVELEHVSCVVLQDVPARALGEGGLRVLSSYVRELGGGLVMTGGRASFGAGGYRASPLEDVLPVTLELRQEQRKAAIALSIVMDRSGSMAVALADGRSKMALAAEGAVAALQLLSGDDEASVQVVDTEAHTLFSLRPARDGFPVRDVARAKSEGGGIYIGVALRAAADQVLSSSKATRHVVLFADAADSEEPDDYQQTIDELRAKDVTVSVIGMGTDRDSDADLLRDIARRGNGRLYFADDVRSLPRIFSEETIAVVRSSFVDAEAPTQVAADWALLGRVPSAPAFSVGGYNVTYARSTAAVALRTANDDAAPLLAAWPHGAGRTVAVTFELDGAKSGSFGRWPHRDALLERLVRWSARTRESQEGAAVTTRLEGDELEVSVFSDGDPGRGSASFGLAGTGGAGGAVGVASATSAGGEAPTLVLLSGDARRAPVEVPMRWEGPDGAVARVTLPGSGSWHPVVRAGTRSLRGAPVMLPWPPEFAPSPPEEGHARLRELARAGGGAERLAMVGLFSEAPRSEATLGLSGPLVALAVLLVVAEALARRLGLGVDGRWTRAWFPRLARLVSSRSARSRVPKGEAPGGGRAGATAPAAAPGGDRAANPTATPAAAPGPAPEPGREAPAQPDKPKGVLDALSEARSRAQRRTGPRR